MGGANNAGPQTHQIKVPAKWPRTVKIPVKKGETWHFSARGWWWDAWIPTSPSGYSAAVATLMGLPPYISHANLFALCGEIQVGGTPVPDSQFIIGRETHHTMPDTGDLVLFANDVDYPIFTGPNFGHVDVLACNGHKPAPPAKWPRATLSLGDIYAMLRKTEGTGLIALLVTAVLWVLGMTEQGRDLVTTLAEDSGPGALSHEIWLGVSLIFLGVQAWYWPRRIIDLNFGRIRKKWPNEAFLTWLPRVLGLAPYVLTIGLIVTCPRDDGSPFNLTACVPFALFVAFLLFLIFRTRFADGLSAKALQRATWTWYAVTALVSAALFFTGVFAPVWMGWTMGATAIVFFAAGGLIPYLALLARMAASVNFPVIGALTAWCLGCAFFNDSQHVVGSRSGVLHRIDPPLQVPARPNLDGTLNDWLARTQPLANGTRPLIIVASEGGASRAGYWTADALAALQTASPQDHRFSNHVFAISSISGGSVGAVGWVKSLAAVPADDSTTSSRVVRDFAGADALGPTLAASLFPDAFQRLLPWPLLPDGAEGLEKGWEGGWRTACKSQCLPQAKGLDTPFVDLWTKRQLTDPWLPRVMVGGASEEDGHRVITAPFTFDAAIPATDAHDFFTLSNSNINQSTAILNGARFPWISSPGLVRVRTEASTNDFHMVDGGYFDASGIETARQILSWIAAKRCNISGGEHIKPILIVVSYTATDGNTEPPRTQTARFANDTVGPLVGLFDARDGHQAHMLGTLGAPDAAGKAAPWQTLRLTLYGDKTHQLPLDWVLSSKMRAYVDRAVEPDGALGAEIKKIESEIYDTPAIPCP